MYYNFYEKGGENVEDIVFQEEEKHLEKTEKRICNMISRCNKEAERCKEELRDFFRVDYDDVDQRGDLRKREKQAREEAEHYKTYLDKPYHARIDLKEESGECQTESYYIGKKGISDRGDLIVVDWREEIGDCFRETSQNRLTVKGIDYRVSLRREFEVAKGTLVSYHTIYKQDAHGKDIVDPFLLSLLEDKRRKHMLTDIVESIQENQSKIIRRPLNESFIVQGCAGSGKTMILLHRLSYLVFNNKQLNLKTIKIITPNDFFSSYIQQVSEQLEIENIKRMSVEQYYEAVITRYSDELVSSQPRENESILDKELLLNIYSLEYMEKNILLYNNYWENILILLNEERLQKLFQTFQIKYPNTRLHTAGIVEILGYNLNSMLKTTKEQRKQEKSLLERLASIKGRISQIEAKVYADFLLLEQIKQQTILKFEKIIANKEKKGEEYRVILNNTRKENAEIQQKIDKESIVVRQNLTKLELADVFAEENMSYEQLVQRDDESELKSLILENARDIIKQIKDLQKLYENVPAYNFSKKGILLKQLKEKEKIFSGVLKDVVSEYTRDIKVQNEKLLIEINRLKNILSLSTEDISETEKKSEVNRVNTLFCQECLNYLQNSDALKTKKSIPKAAYEKYKDILRPHEKQQQIYRQTLQQKVALVKLKTELEQEQTQLLSNNLDKVDIEYIEKCINLLNELQIGSIFKNVFEKLLTKEYENFSIKYKNANYRHTMYLKMLCCDLYFSRNLMGDTFLCIDEAQDISIAEYKLLKRMLGEKCIFNLYGDINQSICGYTGFMDWDEINSIINGNFYILQENYRNTVENTDFCNNEFGAEISAIGILGKEVVETDFNSAIERIISIKKHKPECRVAVLHKSGMNATENLLKKALNKEKVSWYSVDMQTISVVTVEIARGLEFDSIVVLDDQMTESEKYISYTRTLNDLIIVHNCLN